MGWIEWMGWDGWMDGMDKLYLNTIIIKAKSLWGRVFKFNFAKNLKLRLKCLIAEKDMKA